MEEYHNTEFTITVVTIIIICIGLPLTLGAIYAFYCQIRKDHVAPIYVINLLISDLIQLCCMIVLLTPLQDPMISGIFGIIYFSAMAVSVYFRVCIALERYLVITHPQWYCLRRSIKSSVVVCVLVWTIPLAFLLLLLTFLVNFMVTGVIFVVFFSLPLPLLIFFLGGTLKGLSASVSVPSYEKRRTVGILILLLFTDTLLFLPTVPVILAYQGTFIHTFIYLSFIFVRLSPLADLILFVFMRKVEI